MSDVRAKPVINLADVPLRDGGNGKEFKAKIGSFGKAIGSKIGAMLHVVEPGNKAFPYHNHHVTEELFVILEGEGTYRLGGTSHAVKAGDILAAPAGGHETAHQLLNTGNTTLKYLGISYNPGPSDIAEYPDSGKFGVMSRYDWATRKGGVLYVGRAENSLNYFDGEK